ncbi:MAG TPA: hypothetical protein VHY08_15020 [Bacillota bacterium]|nr:hypothetical protein [Bacillota bacterium]
MAAGLIFPLPRLRFSKIRPEEYPQNGPANFVERGPEMQTL